MGRRNPLYCQIFVDADASKSELFALLVRAVRGTGERGTIASDICEIDVRANEFFDKKKRREGDDAFLSYRFSLDVEPRPDASRQRYVDTIGTVLESLWAAGYRAVAACDFEDELPRKGGYRWGDD